MNSTITTAAVRSVGTPDPVQLVPVLALSFGPLAEPLSPVDQEREWLIQAEGLLLQVEMSIWERTGDFAAHGSASRHQARMLELIKGRSEAVRARMAAERGLPA